MTTHDFGRSLAYSHDQADAPWWKEVYQQAFPDMVSMTDLRHDGWHQLAGRDRVVMLSSGRPVYVDEKVRSRDYGDDIGVEVWSVYPRTGKRPYPPVLGAKEGWACKPLDCDYVAYAIVPTQKCHLLPHLGIRAAWTKHGAAWRRNADREANGFRWCEANNGRYLSISIAVPTWLLHEAITDAMTVSWAPKQEAA